VKNHLKNNITNYKKKNQNLVVKKSFFYQKFTKEAFFLPTLDT